jgi:transposase-like protein
MARTTTRHSSTGSRRDFKGMERVRLRATRMFERGTSHAKVAHRLGTSRHNAHRWHRKWQQGGRAALPSTWRAGRRPRLDSRALYAKDYYRSSPNEVTSRSMVDRLRCKDFAYAVVVTPFDEPL